MAVATKYTYSVANDTANGAVANWVLKQEILASAIPTAPKDVNVAGDVLDVWMKDALSAGDQTTLGNVVAAHAGVQTQLSMPHTSDGKPIFLPQLFRGDRSVVFAGRADDVAGGNRWQGSTFDLQKGVVGDATKVMQFIEPVYLAGGGIHYKNAGVGDYSDLKLDAPASPATANAGAGAYDKEAYGGYNRFVPNGSTTGSHDLDLAAKLNANVGFTAAAPVPNPTEAGWFDWDEDTEAVTQNPAQQGLYDLYDAAVPLARFVVEAQMLAGGNINFRVPAVKPKKILPHWQFTAKLHNGSADVDLAITWTLFIARAITT